MDFSDLQAFDRKHFGKGAPPTKLVTFNDKTQSVRLWAEELNIKQNTIYAGIIRGYSLKKILHRRNLKHR